ncbi:thiamine-monophosphate kinase [Capsulimonas corticalis]|uniref:Thiamine-monophosphate kinase n=1 Tax=Capsulimonas corticalis TaxID=2219043 RepID=A0A402CSK9_9BACT|nr:thiamine-phosphate kinase [Capsulimonas corticalis]BDI31055.1 thiamine-monophosphate kinase [Capsulimonas corticalis]
MNIKDIGGEEGFIERMRQTHAGAVGDGLILGIGDDAAIFETPAGRQSVVTTDMLVEQVHFRRDWSDPYSIGWKSAAVNLSDIAAMGAEPTLAFLSIAFSQGESVETLDRIYDGFSDCLNRYGARLAGGDTNSTPDGMVISVTLMGSVKSGQAFTRSGARPGDVLLVTGALGDSAAGLGLLQKYGLARSEKVDKDLINLHRRPQPRVMISRVLAETGQVRAAMDLSDGLLRDVSKLCAASQVGVRIDTAQLPISNATQNAAKMLAQDPTLLALQGGEDYELLVAVAPESVDAVREAVPSLTVIGEILKSGRRIVAANGVDDLDPGAGGWDHFAQ